MKRRRSPDQTAPGSVIPDGGMQPGDRERSGWAGLLPTASVALVVAGLIFFGGYGELGPVSTVQPTSTPLPESTTTVPAIIDSNILDNTEQLAAELRGVSAGRDLAERAGIRCLGEGGNATLYCGYQGEHLHIGMFLDGDQERINEWVRDEVNRGAEILLSDTWGIALHVCSGCESSIGEIREALGEGEIFVVDTLRPVPVEWARLEGGGFFERATTDDDMRRGLGLVVSAESVVDGMFLAQGQTWDEGAVWWESGAISPWWGDGQPRWIELDLGGTFTIGSAIVQADVNDVYLLSYRDLSTGVWKPLWNVPEGSWGGVDTRPNPTDRAERKWFTVPVTTDMLRFEAFEGDGMYSVSEIQVFTALATAGRISPNSDLGVVPPTGGDGSLDANVARLPLGVRTTLPDSARLDFLNTECFEHCFRDAVMVDPLKEQSGEGTWEAHIPFHIREGFVVEAEEPLSDGFNVEVYVTRREGPDLDGGIYEINKTYRFFSDYSLRGTTIKCGPGYWTQTEPQSCEWFIHDFPGGLPPGRYDIWARWFGPCSVWHDLGRVDTCPEPTEVTSMFSSSVNMPFGDY